MKNKPTKLDPTRCCHPVVQYTGGWYRGTRQCERSWTITRNEKHYCKQHDPRKIEERRTGREKKEDMDTARRVLGHAAVTLYDQLDTLVHYLEDGDAHQGTEAKKARRFLDELKGFREKLPKGTDR